VSGKLRPYHTITPHYINYAEPIAKRGSVKDLTITYAFEIFDDKGKATSLAVEPIVIKSLRKGDTFADLSGHLGTMLVGSVPSNTQLESPLGGQKISAPFKMTLTLAETTEGNGVKLAGKIAKELSDAISKDKDALTDKIVGVLIGNDDSPDSGEDGEAKPADTK